MNRFNNKTADPHTNAALRGILCLLVGLLWAPSLRAQTPEEHASHHPDQPTAATPAAGAMPADAPAPAGGMPADAKPAGGGMMEGMGDMMKNMGGKPPQKELYPSLMALPQLTPEQRKKVEEQAGERMHAGTALMVQAIDTLNAGTQSEDYAAMQEAMTRLREGAAQLESGIAARRALAEGRAPREVALAWFKQEMTLSLSDAPTGHPPAGITPFHLFSMLLLVVFALTMMAMYFFKMRRAAALFGRIEADRGLPPPGPSPPLAGGSGPSTPGPPPGGGEQSPSGTNASTTPVAGTPAASTTPPGAPSPGPVTGGDAVSANWQGQLRVGGIVTETPSVKTLRLLPTSNDRFLPFTFVPGQFLNLTFGIGGARMNRSYSISSSPSHRDYVDLTVRREPRGAVSRHIVDLLKVGNEIEAGGPVGKFTFTGAEADSIVLIAAGVGITPMLSITRYLTERSWVGEIFFIYICRTPADFIFASEVAALQRLNPKLHVAVTISKPEGTDWKGARGRITKEWIAQTVPHLTSRRIHICGPPSMMDSTKAMLAELGVPPEQVKTEAFGTPRPTPAAAGTTAKPTAPATGPLVAFSKNNKSAKIHLDLQNGDSPPKQTILELSEELGIGIEFSCRVGTCGVCKIKLTSGEVDQAVQDALDDNDKANNIILACQAKPRGAVTVEA